MNEIQHLEPSENAGEEGNENRADNSHETEKVTEKVKEVPFGLLGASLLLNILQYAVFLGVTMVVLILLRIFMPLMMQMQLP